MYVPKILKYIDLFILQKNILVPFKNRILFDKLRATTPTTVHTISVKMVQERMLNHISQQSCINLKIFWESQSGYSNYETSGKPPKIPNAIPTFIPLKIQDHHPRSIWDTEQVQGLPFSVNYSPRQENPNKTQLQSILVSISWGLRQAIP